MRPSGFPLLSVSMNNKENLTQAGEPEFATLV